jgi:hypothetical protein
MKRINNKRSLYIASKLSGSGQDERLKELSNALNDIDIDLNRCKLMEEKGEKSINFKLLKSNLDDLFLTNGLTLSELIDLSKVIRILDFKKSEMRELVRSFFTSLS